MDLAVLAPLVTGSGGALIVLLAWVYSISQGSNSIVGTVPGYVYKGAEARIDMLEQENAQLNTAVIDLSKRNAGMEAKLSFLSQEVENLKDNLKRFQRKVEDGGT